MGQIVFILLVVGGLGVFFYRQMSAGSAQSDSAWTQEGNSETVTGGIDSNAKSQSDTDAAQTDVLDAQIVAQVSRTPGILQTEIYSCFPDENRKSLQAVLLQMDRDGVLQREREGSSYRLFVT